MGEVWFVLLPISSYQTDGRRGRAGKRCTPSALGHRASVKWLQPTRSSGCFSLKWSNHCEPWLRVECSRALMSLNLSNWWCFQDLSGVRRWTPLQNLLSTPSVSHRFYTSSPAAPHPPNTRISLILSGCIFKRNWLYFVLLIRKKFVLDFHTCFDV